MHIQLTDILTCPVCGPQHGLIVRTDRIVHRRVREGMLGCPNCRRQYAIRDGVAWLLASVADAAAMPAAGGAAPGAPPAAGGGHTEIPLHGQPQEDADASDMEEAVRIAALLGLGGEAGRATGFIALVGRAAARAPSVAALVEGQEIVAVDERADALRDSDHVSRITTDAALPFHDAKLRAVWVGGSATGTLLEEAARALHPMGRLVLEPAPVDARERLAARGLRVLAHERETLVATRA